MKPTRSFDRRQSRRGAVIALLLLVACVDAGIGTFPSAPYRQIAGDPEVPGFDPVHGASFDFSEMPPVEAAATKAANGRTSDSDPAAEVSDLTGFRSPSPLPIGSVVYSETDIPRSIKRWKRDGGKTSAVYVLDPLLASRINALLATSVTFESAWSNLQEAEVPILIGTDSQLHAQIPRAQRDVRWAGITTSWGDGRQVVTRSAVAIRLDWLENLYDGFGNSEALFLEALDELIIHEVYGHLVPVVTAGTLRAACADAVEGELHQDSCVGRRELAILAEIQETRDLAFAADPR